MQFISGPAGQMPVVAGAAFINTQLAFLRPPVFHQKTDHRLGTGLTSVPALLADFELFGLGEHGGIYSGFLRAGGRGCLTVLKFRFESYFPPVIQR